MLLSQAGCWRGLSFILPEVRFPVRRLRQQCGKTNFWMDGLSLDHPAKHSNKDTVGGHRRIFRTANLCPKWEKQTNFETYALTID